MTMTTFELDLNSAPAGVYSLAYNVFPTVSYNSTLKSLDISSSSTNHKVVIPGGGIGVASDQYIVETDIELISDASGRRIVGIALIDPASVSGGYFAGPEVCSLDAGWRSIHRNAWLESDITYVSLTSSSVTYSVGARHVLKFVRSGLHYDFYVDGILVFSFDDTAVREPSLLPGIIVYACAIRVRSFKYSATLLDDAAVTRAIDDGAIRSFRLLAGSMSVSPSRELYGYIEGVVKNSGVPVPDQRVACFDNSHNLIDEVKSGSDGSYRFDNLPRLNGDTYVVMARDSNGLLSPATADNRIPEAYS